MEHFRINTIEDFIELYPSLFSQKRLSEWRRLFSSNAVMAKVNKKDTTVILSIDEAMHEQEEYASENDSFEEKWGNIKKNIHGNIAIVLADYTLTTNHEIREGIDVVTLAYDEIHGWRIISLVYEQTKFKKI